MVLPPGVRLAAWMAERRVTVLVPLRAPVAGLTPAAMLRSARLLTVNTAGTQRSSSDSNARRVRCRGGRWGGGASQRRRDAAATVRRASRRRVPRLRADRMVFGIIAENSSGGNGRWNGDAAFHSADHSDRLVWVTDSLVG